MSDLNTIVGKICVERGWVTQDQLVDCLRECALADTEPGSSASTKLSDVLVHRGYVRSNEMENLRKEVSKLVETKGEYEVVRRGDASLGQVLVKDNVITKAQLVEVLSMQQFAAEKGGAVPRLGELIIQKGFAPFSAIEKALESQKVKTPLQCSHCGTNYSILEFDAKKKYICKKCAGILLPPDQIKAEIPEEVQAASKNPKNCLGKYVVVKELGRGGMGAVYKAWDTVLKRWIALKVLMGTGGKDELARFRREAQTAAALRHPNIVGIFEVDDVGDKHAIAMEYVDGRSLAGEKLPVMKAVEIMADVARAVEYAHSKGIIHRDIKPHNVMIDGEGKPFVMDFGLAKSLEGPSHLTLSGTVVGTPSYMSPEQAEGKTSQVDQQSDVYSLGCVLYETLTGRPPFKGANPVETLRMVVHEDPVLPSQLNPAVLKDLETIILKCLDKDKSRRYSSAKALTRDLDNFASGREIAAKRAALATRMSKRIKRNWAPVTAVVASTVAILLVVIIMFALSGSSTTAKIRDLVNEGRQHLREGNLQAARSSFHAAEKLAPGNAEVQRGLRDVNAAIERKESEDKARAAAEAKKKEEERKRREAAMATARPAMQQGRRKLDNARLTLYQRGADLARTEIAIRNAVKDFTRAIGAFPEFAEAFHLRGQAHALLRDPVAAERDFTAAITHLPDLGPAYYDRGRAYIDLARDAMGQRGNRGAEGEAEAKSYREKAKADLQKYRQLGGGNPEDTQLAEALLAMSESNASLAIQLCDKMIAGRTNNAEVFKVKGDALYQQGDLSRSKSQRDAYYARARQAYADAIAKRVNYAEAYLERGHMQFHLDKTAEALADLKRSVPPDSKNARAYYDRAKILLEMKRTQDARADLLKAYRLNPKDSMVLYRLGYIVYNEKDYRQAADYLDRAVDADPKNSAALTLRGYAREALRNFAGAMEDYKAAITVNPRLSQAFYRMGRILASRNDFLGAEAAFTSFIKLSPGKEYAHYYRGLCYLSLREYRKAIADWEECIKLNSPRADECRRRIDEARAALGS